MATVQAILGVAFLAAALAGCATVNVQDTRVLTGRVTDESGAPVAGNPVLVVARSLDLVAKRLEYEERGRRDVRTATDAEGRYRVEFVPASVGNNFFLFFYDAKGFDRVKYRRPEPVDVTDQLRRSRTVAVNQILQFHPAWSEVARQIAFLGADSDRGRVLRQHGLPEKRDAPAKADDPEVWWYYADGVSYWFVDDRLTRTHQFTPMMQPAPQK
ncbi:MAG: carboxypeptidase regulatory-like domain-containing protein [Zetaproteobacteria bacterium]|jgi:hypothetical protein|nr:MAG: carboxypeptidase regulatory-like domain-containing protein [Zetaproteobacteria bacterium]